MTLAFQLFKNSINTQEKLRSNLHSVSVSELLEYGRISSFFKFSTISQMLVAHLGNVWHFEFSMQTSSFVKCSNHSISVQNSEWKFTKT